MNLEKLEEQLIRHEGLIIKQYLDTADRPRLTIGVGRNLDDVGLRSEAEARFLLRSDILAIRSELEKAIPWIADLSEARQHVLMDMAFNLGVAGLMTFEKTLRLVANGKFAAASVEMMKSRWSDKVGQRAVTLSEMMAAG